MRVKVKYRSQLAEITRVAGEDMEAATVQDVLRTMRDRYGADTEKLARSMLVVVNGKSILQLRHFKTALGEGDEVSFLPICGGG